MVPWPRELNALQIEKKHLQIKKTSILQHARCKCSQHNQTKKRAANHFFLFVCVNVNFIYIAPLKTTTVDQGAEQNIRNLQ